jgi:hypothetical protein
MNYTGRLHSDPSSAEIKNHGAVLSIHHTPGGTRRTGWGYTKIILVMGEIIKSRRMRWAGHVARIGEKRKAYRLLVGKPEGNRPLGRERERVPCG